jgi:5-hydroxyisourate hydrolase
MASFSVHVTDAVYGRPAEGIPVRLYHGPDVQSKDIGLGRTDANGQFTMLADSSNGALARLELDTDSYFATLGVRPVYPSITLTFRVTESRPRSALSLLIAPSAYVIYLEN